MAGTRSANTQAEGLTSILSMIAQLKTAPDADPQFLVALETAILQYVRAPLDAAMQKNSAMNQGVQPGQTPDGGMGGGGGMPMGMQPPGMPQGMPPGGGGGLPPGAGGLPGPQGIPPMRQGSSLSGDELRRMIGP